MKTHSAVSLAVAVTLLAGNAVAQEVEGLEEIVVTATKREQTLQNVPVAVTVTPVETLERAQIRNISDLQSVVPSLRVSTNQTSIQTTFLIRGFGNGANNPGIEPAVGVFIDGVYRSRSAGAIGDLVDVQRVEVLRGPQSTLFGQNTTAGVINIVTQKPSLTESSGFVEASLGNYNERVLRAKFSGPISDTVAGSITAVRNKRDGYFKVLPSTRAPQAADINDRDRTDLRAQLLWQPNDNLEVRLIGDISSIDELCCGVVNVLDGATGNVIRGVGGQIYSQAPFDRSAYINRLPENEVNNSGLSVHVDWKLGDFTLTAIAANRSQDYDFVYDFDFTSASLGGTNRNVSDTTTSTQEVRVSYDAGGRLRGLLGAYLLDEDVNYRNQIFFGADARNYAASLAAVSSIASTLGRAPSSAELAALLPGATAQILGLLSQLETRTAIPGAALGLPFSLSAGPGAGRYFANGSGNDIFNTQANKAWTAFGQLEFDFTDQLTLTAGLARTNSQKDIDYRSDAGEPFAAENLVTIGFFQILNGLTANPALGAIPVANLVQLADRASVADGVRVPCVPLTVGGATITCLRNQLLGFYPLQFLSPVQGFTGASDDSKTTYTAKLSYDVNDNMSVYGGIATGFKATSWNLSRDSRPVQTAPSTTPLGTANPWYPRFGSRKADPEEATSLEFGFKARWDRAALNIAVFDTEIEGFQENTFRGTGFVLSNAGQQSAKGIEIESRFKVTPALTAELAGTWLKPKYDSYPGAPNACTTGITSVDRSGQRPFGIHGQSVSAALTYAWSRGETDGFVRADYQYESNTVINTLETSATNCNVSPPTNTFSSFRKVNSLTASAGFTRDDWMFMIWGRNLTNNNYLTATFPGVAQAGTVSGYPNEPRTYGLTVRKNFGGK